MDAYIGAAVRPVGVMSVANREEAHQDPVARRTTPVRCQAVQVPGHSDEGHVGVNGFCFAGVPPEGVVFFLLDALSHRVRAILYKGRPQS